MFQQLREIKTQKTLGKESCPTPQSSPSVCDKGRQPPQGEGVGGVPFLGSTAGSQQEGWTQPQSQSLSPVLPHTPHRLPQPWPPRSTSKTCLPSLNHQTQKDPKWRVRNLVPGQGKPSSSPSLSLTLTSQPTVGPEPSVTQCHSGPSRASTQTQDSPAKTEGLHC